jgi:hypothetical protein
MRVSGKAIPHCPIDCFYNVFGWAESKCLWVTDVEVDYASARAF